VGQGQPSKGQSHDEGCSVTRRQFFIINFVNNVEYIQDPITSILGRFWTRNHVHKSG
jgi:hypothetical protein